MSPRQTMSLGDALLHLLFYFIVNIVSFVSYYYYYYYYYYLQLGRHPGTGVFYILHYICTNYEGLLPKSLGMEG